MDTTNQANNEESGSGSDQSWEKVAGPPAGEQRDVIWEIFEDNPATYAKEGDVWCVS